MKKFIFILLSIISMNCFSQEERTIKYTDFGVIKGLFDVYNQAYLNYWITTYQENGSTYDILESEFCFSDIFLKIKNQTIISSISLSKYDKYYDYCKVYFKFHYNNNTTKEISVDSIINGQEYDTYFKRGVLIIYYSKLPINFIEECKRATSVSIKYYDDIFEKERISNISLIGFTKTYNEYLSLGKHKSQDIEKWYIQYLIEAIDNKTKKIDESYEKSEELNNKQIENKYNIVHADSLSTRAEFPGGLDNLMIYIQKNLRIPARAYDNNIRGKVVITFIVTEDGYIEDIKCVKSLDPDCDKEAIRVIKSLPKWKPATKDGKNVCSSYAIPIVFKF